jgi:mono/diheme cytochrome c family protein
VHSMVVMPLFLALIAAQAGEPVTAPGQGGQSQPKVVRKEYDMRQLELSASGQLSEPELAGRRLFAQRCGLCHDPVGQMRVSGPWLDRDLLATKGEAAARQYIEQGSRRMPGFKHALTAAQMDHLIAFLKTVTPEQRPKAATR